MFYINRIHFEDNIYVGIAKVSISFRQNRFAASNGKKKNCKRGTIHRTDFSYNQFRESPSLAADLDRATTKKII